VQLTRSSLCSILLENGEEDLAVLKNPFLFDLVAQFWNLETSKRKEFFARSDLPEVLDSAAHAPMLADLGLSEEDLQTLLPAVSGDPPAAGDDSEMTSRTQTISDRWADLVSVWTGTSDRTHR
jgi:hypothetical protein